MIFSVAPQSKARIDEIQNTRASGYVLGANAYIQKPVSPEELSDIICELYRFWSKCQVPDAPKAQACS